MAIKPARGIRRACRRPYVLRRHDHHDHSFSYLDGRERFDEHVAPRRVACGGSSVASSRAQRQSRVSDARGRSGTASSVTVAPRPRRRSDIVRCARAAAGWDPSDCRSSAATRGEASTAYSAAKVVEPAAPAGDNERRFAAVERGEESQFEVGDVFVPRVTLDVFSRAGWIRVCTESRSPTRRSTSMRGRGRGPSGVGGDHVSVGGQ